MNENIKFNVREINVTENPIMIVGLAPGRQRKGEKTQIAWEGNRSADLINEAIAENSNIVLTNVINFYSKEKISKEDISAGAERLKEDIVKYCPSKIITLGAVAEVVVAKIKVPVEEVFAFQHPSYIIRFGKDRAEYINEIRERFE